MEATYTQLRSGDWGVRVQGAVKPGAVVTVRKRDGSTKSETVQSVVWSGGGVTLCSISRRSSDTEVGGNGGGGARKCADCGGPVRGTYRYCYECGLEHRDGGSQAHGGQSYYDRNGRFVLGDDD